MLETVRAYGLERLAEAGEEAAVRDAAARYYLAYAESADPQLRTSTQARWFRALTAEQDNLNAAVRWSVARGDAGLALRFVRSLGYYWVQRGHGEADALCRAVLALPPPPLTQALAEARVICALLAAGWNWDIELIRQPLQEALAALSEFGPDYETIHPLVAMAEPVLLSYDGDMEQAQRHFARYPTASDPWLCAVGKVYHASYALTLGNLEGAEESCRAGLAELRALGEQWGVAMALTQLAEFTELRGDHAASARSLSEAVAIGRELGMWGDRSYVEARLALVRARAGDLDRGREELALAGRAAASRGATVDTDRWVAYMRAELAALAGDHAEAARCCEDVLAVIEGNAARWWESLRAVVRARLAIALLDQGDQGDQGEQGEQGRAADLLRQALDAAERWWDRPTLAAVLDACAVYAQFRAAAPDPELSARLLGAAAAARGAVDESSLDGRRARQAALAALGGERFGRACAAGRGDDCESAVALARQLFAGGR